MGPGAGIDIVSVGRVAKLIDRCGASFLERWFTAAEIEYCNQKAVPSRHYAARLAAKEAVVKVLPWDGPLPWRSIEIVNDRRGAPTVRLSGPVLEAARRAGIGNISVSLSHCDEYATAVAFLSNESRRLTADRRQPAASRRGRVLHR